MIPTHLLQPFDDLLSPSRDRIWAMLHCCRVVSSNKVPSVVCPRQERDRFCRRKRAPLALANREEANTDERGGRHFGHLGGFEKISASLP